MSIQWAQPYSGIIAAVHLPAEIWRPNQGGGMDPGPAVIFNNNFGGGASGYDRMDGWNFSQPTGVVGYGGALVDTEVLLPDWTEGYTAPWGPVAHRVALEFTYVCTGDASASQLCWRVGAKVCPEGANFSTYSWTNSDVRQAGPGPAGFSIRTVGPLTLFLPNGYGPNRVVRLRVARLRSVGGLNDTWPYEAIFTGATFYYLTA